MNGPSHRVVDYDGVTHEPADPSTFVPGRGWVRACTCGREFVSEQEWQHVPALFDHLATVRTTVPEWLARTRAVGIVSDAANNVGTSS